MEILTGQKAGKKKSDNTFEPNTIYALVAEKLQRYADDWKKFESRN